MPLCLWAAQTHVAAIEFDLTPPPPKWYEGPVVDFDTWTTDFRITWWRDIEVKCHNQNLAIVEHKINYRIAEMDTALMRLRFIDAPSVWDKQTCAQYHSMMKEVEDIHRDIQDMDTKGCQFQDEVDPELDAELESTSFYTGKISELYALKFGACSKDFKYCTEVLKRYPSDMG